MKTTFRLYEDCHHAIRDANGAGSMAVGWSQNLSRWTVYDPKDGAPYGFRPEFLCTRSGRLPIALSVEGQEILRQMVEAA